MFLVQSTPNQVGNFLGELLIEQKTPWLLSASIMMQIGVTVVIEIINGIVYDVELIGFDDCDVRLMFLRLLVGGCSFNQASSSKL